MKITGIHTRHPIQSFKVSTKLVLSYVVLILMVTIVIAGVSYGLSTHHYQNEIFQLNHKLLTQYSTTIEETIIHQMAETRRNMILDINLNTDMDILFEKNPDSGKVLSLYKDLISLVNASDGLYQGIHIYAKNNNLVLSSILGLKYLNRVNPNSWRNLIWVTEIPDTAVNTLWIPTRTVSYSLASENNVASCISTYPTHANFNNAKGYIKFDINEDYIRYILNQIELGDSDQLYLLDRMGNIIAHSNASATPGTIYDLGYPSLDFFQSPASNGAILTLNETEQLVSYVPIHDDWYLVRSVPTETYYSTSRHIALLIALISIAATTSAIIISQLFAAYIYRPLKLLAVKAANLRKGAEPIAQPGDEYTIIDHAITDASSEITVLHNKWESNIHNLKQNLLRNIISNTLHSHDDFIQRMHLINRPVLDGQYNMIVIHSVAGFGQAVPVQDQDEIIENLCHHVETYNGSHIQLIASRIEADSIGVMVISKKDDLDALMHQIIHYAHIQLDARLHITLGHWKPSVLQCHKAYLEANNAYRYLFFQPDQAIFAFRDYDYTSIQTPADCAIYYNQYAKALMNKKLDPVHHTIDAFCQFISAAPIPLDKRYEALQNMAFVLSKYARDFYVGPMDIDLSFHYMQYRFYTLDDFQQWIRQSTMHILALMKGQTTHQTDDIIHNIKKYIDNHLGKDLSLTQIADHLALSKSYVSHIFKDATGITVVDYITQQRMARAKRMLEATSLNIEDIAIGCGYFTPHYFSKKFKQYYGLAPRSYRVAYEKNRTS